MLVPPARLLALGVVSVGAVSSVAQAQDVRSEFGTVAGFTVDSISGGPLAGAYVALQGAPRGALSDSTGRFTIDSVEPGTHRLLMFHRLLDMLRLTVRTADIRVVAGDTVVLILATPSPETIVARKCSDAPGDEPGALAGVVLDAAGNPVDRATVLLRWEQVLLDPNEGIRQRTQRRAGTTLSDGTFEICGLPTDLAAELRATKEADTTGALPLRLESGVLAIAELTLPGDDTEIVETVAASEGSGLEEATIRRGRALVFGEVSSARGEPVPGARVWIDGAESVGETDSTGAFVLLNQPSGSQTLQVRKIGYEALEIPLGLRADAPVEVSLVMQDFVPLLEEVIVRARRDFGLERVGFAMRARAGAGYYLRPEDIEKRPVFAVSDLFLEVPQLRVHGSGRHRLVTGRAGNCVAYAIDGQRWRGGSPDDHLNPGEVAAIEVYSSAFAPAVLPGSGSCDVVMIWTKGHLALR